MKLNYDVYKDKVYACWLGKNIGGTIGMPYEGCREKLSLTGFTTPPKEPLPNDDLDLQLLWLHALQHEGAKSLTSEKLGEYWQTYVVQYWNEYGICKNNMKMGLYPQVAGEYKNPWKDSNGAWIRTEIWATLSPACPDIAVRYAIEDAKVDHGFGEGTYAAAFVAALESAAFVISDVRELISIGLSKIPEDCRIAKTVNLVLNCFDEGKTADETRDLIVDINTDVGDGWFQAPSNLGYVILGLLYGNGDFKKSLLFAVNCGDDTDCTAATIGSIMGLIYGTKSVPSDWVEYISDKIVTLTIARLFPIPKTCAELTEKIVNFVPAFLIENEADVKIVDGESEIPEGILSKFKMPASINWGRTDEYCCAYYSNKNMCSFTVKAPTFTAIICYKDNPEIKANDEKEIYVRILNNVQAHGNIPRTVHIRVLDVSQELTVDKNDFFVNLPHFTTLSLEWISDYVPIVIKSGESVKATNRILLEFYEEGRYTRVYAPIVFLGVY